MRKIQYITLIFPVLLLLLFSCREVYYPEGLNTGKVIPVIQGQIAEDESPRVVLSRAMDYESAVPDYISGAEVIVSDNKGNEVTLTEGTKGHYVDAEGEMYGVVGTAYKLEVNIEGEEFVSSMLTIPENPIVDSLYAEPGTNETYFYNLYNQPVSVIYDGLYLSTSLSAKGDSTVYYRFNTAVLMESVCIKDPGTMSPTPVYLWEPSTMDYIYSVDFTMKSNNREVRPGHANGFLRYFNDPTSEIKNYSAPVILGWVITLKVYAISSDVYKYYQLVGAQLNSNDQMFAPVPSQVRSNIRCTTHPELPVSGVFDATSSSTYYKAFRWINRDTYEYVNLESFPSGIQKGTTLSFPPSFWISFN